MVHETLATTVMAVIALLLLAAISAVVTKRLRFPHTVGLVLLGVALAFVAEDFAEVGAVLEQFKLAPAMIMFLFIPLLIFESAFNTDVRRLWREIVPVAVLAGPGLLLSTALIGTLVYAFTSLPLGSALIFGCLISATDPVAVIALFKDLGAPKRLSVIVEGESVFNDATAIVTFQILLAVVTIGLVDTRMVLEGVIEFFVVFFGGLGVGLAFGYLLVRLITLIGDEPLVHITLTLVAAYGAFMVADHMLETSGIMAVLGAGLVVGYYGPVLYSKKVREYLEIFWEDAAFVANSLIFLMLGLSEQVFLSHAGANLNGLLIPVLIVIAVVLAARVAVTWSLVPLVNRLPGVQRIDGRYRAVMAWGGLRGAIAVALAMSLPAHFPYRWQIIDFAFGVTLFMLLFNATTVGRLMSRLGLDRAGPAAALSAAYARAEAQAVAGEPEAENRAAAKLEELREEVGTDPETRRRFLWLRAIGIQHAVYREHFADGFLSWRTLRDLEAALRGIRAVPLDDPAALLEPPVRSTFARAAIRLDRLIWKWLPGLAMGRPRGWAASLERDERARAVEDAAGRVLIQMEILQALSGALPEEVETCRRFFQRLAEHAGDEIRQLEADAPELADRIRQHRLARRVRDRGGTIAQDLAIDDDVAEALAERLGLADWPESTR